MKGESMTVKVEIFTGPGCDYCVAAKQLLVKHNLGFRERDISRDEVRAEMKTRLPREKTIPQIFINGDHIGGYEDLRLHFQKAHNG
jgi:glutaredoxin 3